MVKTKIIFLGTSDAIPSAERNHSEIALVHERANILFDCGEGTQRQFRKVNLNPGIVTHLCLKHWHGDHILGIPGLLQTLAFSEYKKQLKVYGPKGIERHMSNMMQIFAISPSIVDIEEKIDEICEENEDFQILTRSMDHNAPCNAYSFIQKARVRIDKQKIKKLKLPEGPHLKGLKDRKDIMYEGKKYKYKDLTYTIPEKKIVIILDTKYNPNMIELTKNADILICESSFSDELKYKASEYKHMTAGQAATVAKKANVKQLILTHISQRYSNAPQILLKEAKAIFKDTILAKDLMQIEI